MSNSHGRIAEITPSRSCHFSALVDRVMLLFFLEQCQLLLLSRPFLGFLVGIHPDQLEYNNYKLFKISLKNHYSPDIIRMNGKTYIVPGGTQTPQVNRQPVCANLLLHCPLLFALWHLLADFVSTHSSSKI